jgi:hypothetical protein
VIGKLQYAKAAKFSLKDHPEFNEVWLRDIIASDTSILGLGELTLKDTERMQSKAGRLDLLLQDPDEDKRYEVEIMLGRVDESHIIRCIEYWDIERKQLPSFDHCAVLVAEEITARFLNVISLFNSAIPMIALQLNAIEIDGKVVLNFTRVLDEVTPMTEDEEEELSEKEVTDRAYWKEKGSDLSLALADQCLEILREIDPSLIFTYTKHYIGLRQGNHPNNFVVFKAKKGFLRLELRGSELEAIREGLEKSELEVLSINKRRSRVRFVLHKGEIDGRRALLKGLFEKSYQESQE